MVVVLSLQHNAPTLSTVIIFLCTSQDGAPENKERIKQTVRGQVK